MANHMSAREAWEIVKGGNPMHRRYPEEWEVLRYARACAIVEACVKEHEAKCVVADGGLRGGRVGAVHRRVDEYARAFLRTRALERGEEGK